MAYGHRYHPKKHTARVKTRRGFSQVRKVIRKRPFRRPGKGIISNARAIDAVVRRQMRNRVWTDYFYNDSLVATHNTWFAYPLMGMSSYTAALRINRDVEQENSTWVRNINLEIQTYLPPDSNNCTWNIFVVRPRRMYGDMNFVSAAPVDQTDSVQGMAYGKIILNQGVYKICNHFYFNLGCNYQEQGTPTANAPVPNETIRRMHVSIPVKTKMQADRHRDWTQLDIMNAPYWARFYLIGVCSSVASATEYPLQFSAHMTCINSD